MEKRKHLDKRKHFFSKSVEKTGIMSYTYRAKRNIESEVSTMNGKELMEKEIYPSKIVFVMKVPVTVHVPVHKDRPFHGFAYHLQGEKE